MESTLKKFSVIFFLLLTACVSDEKPFVNYCINIKTGVEFTYHSENVKYRSAGLALKPYNIITDTDGFTHQVTYETLPDYICKKI